MMFGSSLPPVVCRRTVLPPVVCRRTVLPPVVCRRTMLPPVVCRRTVLPPVVCRRTVLPPVVCRRAHVLFTLFVPNSYCVVPLFCFVRLCCHFLWIVQLSDVYHNK